MNAGLSCHLCDFSQRIWAAATKHDIIELAKIIPVLGTDPMSSRFGARIVPLGPDQEGHSGYVEHKSLGVLNFARILTGRLKEIA